MQRMVNFVITVFSQPYIEIIRQNARDLGILGVKKPEHFKEM